MSDDAARRAITALVEAIVDAWNRHDARAFAASFAEDVDYTNVFGMLVQGRAGVEQSHATIFASVFKDSVVTATATRIRFLRPDVGAVDIHWEMTGARLPDGSPWPKRQGLMNAIAVANAGRWSFAVFHNQDIPETEHARAVTGMLKTT
jgi:uncharacterized protein (TIGR02246 family)